MGGKSSSPPPPPDPYQVAGAQTQQNQDSAAYNAALNRINTYTPYGSQTYNVTGTDPATGAPIYQQNINLSAEQQQLLDQQNQQNLQLGNLGSQVIGGLSGNPMDTSGLPGLVGQVNPQGPGIQSGYQQFAPQQNLNTSGLPGLQSGFQATGPQLGLNTSNLPGLETDYTDLRNRSEEALYGRNTRYLDDDFTRREEGLRTRLANQGITEGTEAYSNAIDDFERGRETAYANARDASIAGGGEEAQRAFGINSAARGQLYGEALSGGQFGNQAANQATQNALLQAGFGNQARGQGFGEALGSGAFGNAAAGQATAQNAQQAGFGNDAYSQQLSALLAQGGFQNAAQSQGLQELLSLRNQPLNEFNAYRSAGQINLPQFQGTYNPSTNPADIAGAINNNYQGQLDIYNANQQGTNNLMSGLFGLGSAGIMALSDERAKDNIESIGELNDGTGLYSYTYKGSTVPQVGVMAQEVEKTNPAAVKTGRDGLKRVHYGRVLASALEAM